MPSCGITADKFNHESSGGIKDQILRGGIVPVFLKIFQKIPADQEVAGGHDQLCRQRSCRRTGPQRAVRKMHIQRCMGLDAVAAAGKEAADAAKALGYSDTWCQDIEIIHEIQFLIAAIEPSGQKTADNAAVDDPAAASQNRKRIADELVEYRQTVQQLGTGKTADQNQKDNRIDLVRIQTVFLSQSVAHEICCHDTNGDHDTVSVDREIADCQPVIVHTAASMTIILFHFPLF